MPWFKVDDNLAFHSKTVSAGNAALGLWVRCGSWSAATLTEGFIPDHMVTAFQGGKLAPSLVASRLWERVDGGYQFHDWAKYQPSKETVEAERENARERQRRARERAKSLRDTSSSDRDGDGVTEPVSHAVTEPVVTVPPSLSHPIPTQPLVESSGKPPRASKEPKSSLPSGWQPSRESVQKIAEEYPGYDTRRETVRFADYWHGNAETRVDWESVWRNWMRKEAESGRRLRADDGDEIPWHQR